MSGVLGSDKVRAARGLLLERIERATGPGSVPRLDEALTHPSWTNERGGMHNQRLEFLGDAVLGLCVSELLAAMHPDADEGDLSRMRSALVNATTLALWARAVDLGAAIELGRGAQAERDRTNVLADATEAVVAAVYDARGLEGARAFVREVLRDQMADAAALAEPDPKSALQELVQGRGGPAPVYRVVSIRGASHAQTFEVEVLVGDVVAGRGDGPSKRAAERAAARAALDSEATGAGGAGEGGTGS
jgi:ribonuclease-3